nr:hypothetical protein [Tanacetum cinerariifolium]
MRRVGKGFSGVETPLFEGMQVGVIEEEGDAKEQANKVKVLKLRRLKKVGTSQRIDSSDDTVMEDASNQGRMIDAVDSDAGVALMDDKEEGRKSKEAKVAGDDQVKERQAKIFKIDIDHASKVLSKQEDEPKVHEVVDVVTTAKLITEVVTATSESVTAASITIAATEPQVPVATITAALVRVVAASTKRRKGVLAVELGLEIVVVAEGIVVEYVAPMIIDSSDDTVMEDASNQGRMINALDSDAGVALMDDKEEGRKAKEAKVAGDDQVKERQAKIYKIDIDHASKVLSMQEDEPKVHEVVDVVTTAKLITEVVTATS